MARAEDIHKGMRVYSADGKRLGKVLATGSSKFQVERGLFLHHDFLVSNSDVADISGRTLRLRQPREDVRGWDGGYHDLGYADRGYAGF